jgi:hypothetical protein
VKHLTKIIWLLTLSGSCLAQSTQGVLVDNVWRAFFGHIVFLNARAQALAPSDPNGAALSMYYPKLLALSPSEALILDQVATTADAVVIAQDAKAQAIILQTRALYPPGRVPSKAFLPPHSSELSALWQERSAIIMAQVQNLQAQLSPATFTRIEKYVRVKFAAYVHPLSPQAANNKQIVGGAK